MCQKLLVQNPWKCHQQLAATQKLLLIRPKFAEKLQKNARIVTKDFPSLAGFPRWEIRKGQGKILKSPSLKLARRFIVFSKHILHQNCFYSSIQIWFQVIIVDPNRSGYFNFRALAVVSRERFSGSGSRKFKEVEVHCTEANVLKEDTFWLPTRSLEMEIWSPVREANMRLQNKIYEEHIKSFEGLPCSCSNSKF